MVTQSVSFSLGTKGVYEPINVFQASVLILSAYVPLAYPSHMNKRKVIGTGSTHSTWRKGTTPLTWRPPRTTGVLGSLTLLLALEDFGVPDLHCFLPDPTHTVPYAALKKLAVLLSTIPGSSKGNFTSEVSILGPLT